MRADDVGRPVGHDRQRCLAVVRPGQRQAGAGAVDPAVVAERQVDRAGRNAAARRAAGCPRRMACASRPGPERAISRRQGSSRRGKRTAQAAPIGKARPPVAPGAALSSYQSARVTANRRPEHSITGIPNEPPPARPTRRLPLVPRDHHALDGQRRVPACEQRQLLLVSSIRR